MPVTDNDHTYVALFDEDGVTRLAWLVHARAVSWQEENSKPGTGSFEVPLDDDTTALITPRRIVKLNWIRLGVPVATFAVRIMSESTQLSVDGRRWVRFDSQPGLLSMLADATVYPEYGLERRSPTSRLFGFMSSATSWFVPSQWVYPLGYTYAEETTIRKGYPPEMKTVNPAWIGAVLPSVSVPMHRVNFFRAHFNLPDTTNVEFVFTADNWLTLYVDGQEIMTPDLSSPYGWRTATTVRMNLAGGDHLVAARVENAPATHTGAGNPLGLIGFVAELDDAGKQVGILLRTNMVHWQVAVGPSLWGRAEVLRQLVMEARDRGVVACTNLFLGFTPTHDSAGADWTDTDSYAFDVGTVTVADIATQLSESTLDVAVDCETMKLNAWRRRGSDLSGTVRLRLGDDTAGGTLKSFESATEAPRFTTVLTQVHDGSWVETVDTSAVAASGRVETGLNLGSALSSATAGRLADAQLAENSTARHTVTSEPSTLEGAVAYIDYGIGDTITVPGPRNVGTMTARVLSLTVDATGEVVRAWPEYVQDESSSSGGSSPSVTLAAVFAVSSNQRVITVDGTASTAVSPATIAGYSWDWGDGSTAGYGAAPTHAYTADGPYTVVLTVTDSLGATDTTSQSVAASAATTSTSVAYSLDMGINGGVITETEAQILVKAHSVYGRGIGSHTKWYDGGRGIRAAIASLAGSGYGATAGEVSPYVCYKGPAVVADLQYAFDWLVTNFPDQLIYVCHDQEVESGSVTPAQYIAKTNVEYSTRAQDPAWQQWIRLWPCLMGYKETIGVTAGRTWRNFVQPSVGKVDGMSWDIYQMDAPFFSNFTPALYFGPMFTAAQAMGIPCSVGEWGTTLGQNWTSPPDTETIRGARTQSVIDYLNDRAYHPDNRPWGCMWANYWENDRGLVGTTTQCNTGFIKYVQDGVTLPAFTVIRDSLT